MIGPRKNPEDARDGSSDGWEGRAGLARLRMFSPQTESLFMITKDAAKREQVLAWSPNPTGTF